MQTEKVLVKIFLATIYKFFIGSRLYYCNIIFNKAINHAFHRKFDGL